MAETNRFGPYVLSDFGNIVNHIAEWKPAVVVLHDGEAKAENVFKIKGPSPNTKVYGRLYRPDSWYSEAILSNPKEAARDIALALSNTDWAEHVDAVITSNEVCQDWASLPALNEYYLELQRIVPYPLVLYSFSVENPGWNQHDPDGWHASLIKHWALVEESMIAGIEHGDVLGIHEYNANRVTLGDYEEVFRAVGRGELGEHIRNGSDAISYMSEDMKSDFRRVFRYAALVWPFLSSAAQALPVAVTEFGWDFLLWPYNYKSGWLDPSAAMDTDDAQGQLSWFCYLWDTAFPHIPVTGWVLYGAGDSGSWQHYDITSVEMPNGERRERPLVDDIIRHNTGGYWPRHHEQPPQDVESIMIDAANDEQCISGNFDGALQKNMIVDNHFPVSNEFERVVDGMEYSGQKGEAVDEYDPRVYYTRTGDWHNIVSASTD